jgi:hypothetical protein
MDTWPVFLEALAAEWLRMFLNTLNFFLWVSAWLQALLYATLILWPQRLAVGFYQWLLLRLPPVVRVCNEDGCTLSDVGKSLVVVVSLLGLVWFLKRQERKENH